MEAQSMLIRDDEQPKSVILVIDDNPTNLSVLAEHLLNQNFEVLVAQDGETGIERAQLTQPDLILLDIVLPGLNGFDTCRRLKADPNTADIPVIFITAYADDIQRKVTGFQVGAVDYITKPLNETEVTARVAAHVRLRVLNRRLQQQTVALQGEIAERKQAEAALQLHREQLEALVQARTSELQMLNAELEQRVRERTAELEGSNKELEAFSYTVSHDLRVPLRAIDGYSSMLMEDYLDILGEEGQRICQVIRDETRRSSQLINDILEFSRANRAPIQATSIDMHDLVVEVFDDLTWSEDQTRLEFQVEALPTAIGDPNLLKQVWVNLLSNAVKYSSKRTRAIINVSGSQADGMATYRLQDNGAGFDMAYAAKLFGVFQRLHSDKEFPGTGVGLFTAQRIIERHGGRIWAESWVDQGATFWFTLPIHS